MPSRDALQYGISFTVRAAGRLFAGISFTVASEKAMAESYQSARGSETIERLGTDIQIIRNRNMIAYSKAIMTPVSGGISVSSSKVVREIYIKTDDDIQSGDYLYDIKRSEYHIFLSRSEYVSENQTIGISGITARCNQTIAISRTIEKPSGAGGLKSQFEEIYKDVPAALEFIRGGLNESEIGFYKSSTHRMYLPIYFGVSENDRIKVGTDYLRINAVDKITYASIAHCAVTKELR